MADEFNYEKLSDLDILYQLRSASHRAIEAINENERLKKDVKEWQTLYNDLLNSSIKHSHAMSGNILKMAIENAVEKSKGV